MCLEHLRQVPIAGICSNPAESLYRIRQTRRSPMQVKMPSWGPQNMIDSILKQVILMNTRLEIDGFQKGWVTRSL